MQSRQALKVFIVEASSLDQLHNITERNMRSTIWWNHMASFFIVDRSPKCTNAIDFLHVPWRLNVLNAKVICYHLVRGAMIILNYNPYTNQAPYPWLLIDVFRATNNHPFAVFARPYQKNEGICLNLDFDKTKNLGKYEISIEGEPPNGKKTLRAETTLNIYQYWTTRERILHNICSFLNATPIFAPLLNYDDRITTDVRKLGRFMLYVWGINKITYPFTQTGFILVSRFRGHKTQLEKILCVVDFNSRLGIGIVYFVTLIFLKFFVLQNLAPALLNLVRITCNAGLTHLSNRNAPRIFLAGLLFFVVTIQGIYQSNLASLLTTHVPRRNVDAVQDIVDLDYKLYTYDYMKNIVEVHPELEKRLILTDGFATACWPRMKNDSSAACLLAAQGGVLDMVKELELHTSSEFITTLYSAFEIRLDWPLEQKVNIILSIMVEADVILPWDVKCKPVQLSDFKYDKEVQNNEEFKKIELAELAFAFVILGIGLACATIVFVIELGISLT